MDEQQRPRVREHGGGGAGGFGGDGGGGGTVDVAHGPYRESLPVAEMSVAEVRRRFQDMLDIHPEAVALVDGNEVDDATRLRAGQMLMFVRPSGEKGVQLPLAPWPAAGGPPPPARPAKVAKKARAKRPSAVVTIEGGEASVRLPEGTRASLSLEDLAAAMRPPFPDTGGVLLPDGVKTIHPSPRGFVVVHQTPPRCYSFRWIAGDSAEPYGHGASYRTVRLALPYVVTLAVFERVRGRGAQLSGRNECFFVTETLDRRGLDSELCYPALLNCSKFAAGAENPLAWICTQHLPYSEIAGRESVDAALRDGLRALLRHLFESAFNYSSEHHELSSWFTETLEAGIDPRVASVEDWEKASAEAPLFVLDVPWLPTGHTLREALERIHRSERSLRLRTADDLARLMLQTAAEEEARKEHGGLLW